VVYPVSLFQLKTSSSSIASNGNGFTTVAVSGQRAFHTCSAARISLLPPPPRKAVTRFALFSCDRSPLVRFFFFGRKRKERTRRAGAERGGENVDHLRLRDDHQRSARSLTVVRFFPRLSRRFPFSRDVIFSFVLSPQRIAPVRTSALRMVLDVVCCFAGGRVAPPPTPRLLGSQLLRFVRYVSKLR
jgi:hypothetical protein